MLKSILATGEQLVVPGVFDALSSHVASQAGFKAVYMSGFAVSASLIAKPDIGLVTASEITASKWLSEVAFSLTAILARQNN